MIPSWYDVLDVAADASADEIRAAWQESVAGLDPTDRRFKQRNRAAEVLLDPARRAAHDQDLAAQDDQDDDWDDRGTAVPVATSPPDDAPATDPDAATDPSDAEVDETGAADHATPAPVVLDKPARGRSTTTTAASGTDEPETDDEPSDEPSDGPSDGADDEARTGPSGRLLGLTVGLGVLAVVLLLAVVVSLVRGGGSDGSDRDGSLPDSREIAAARKAAETAVGPVLSYDYRDLDKSFAAAKSFMTPKFQGVYDQNVGAYVEENAPTTKTIVTAEVLGSGVVRTGEDRVDVLVFVNRPTRNASVDTVSRDQVTVRMVDVDDRWLVDCLVTAPGGSC